MDENGSDLELEYIYKDMAMIKKNWNSIIDAISEKIYEYILEAREGNSSICPKYQSLKDVKKDIKIEYINYGVFRNRTRCFRPFVDFEAPYNHIPNIEGSVTDTEVTIDRISFDG